MIVPYEVQSASTLVLGVFSPKKIVIYSSSYCLFEQIFSLEPAAFLEKGPGDYQYFCGYLHPELNVVVSGGANKDAASSAANLLR